MLYKDLIQQRTDSSECPFCGGANRVVKETPLAYLTYALAPYHKHHLLIVPKRHIISLHDITRNEMEDMLDLQHFGIGLLRALGYEDVSILIREGRKTGQSIKHLHYHAIPNIRIGDLDHEGNDRKVMTDAEVEKIFGELKKVATERENKM